MNIMRSLFFGSSVALALGLSTRFAGADVVYVSQSRSVSAAAMFGEGGGSASAPNFLEFNRSFTDRNTLGWGNGASASHHSTLNPTRMDAGGSQSAWGGIQHSWGESSSVFDVTFAVDTPTKYVLYGSWEASPSSYTLADAGVEFIGPGGTIYATRSYRDSTSMIYEDTYDLSGTLEPGVYRLKTYGSGRASAGTFDGCSSSFQTTLLISAPAAESCQGQWLALDPTPALGVNGPARAFAMYDPDGPGPSPSLLLVGGEFTQAGTIAASNLAALNPATRQWVPLGTGTNGGVKTLLVLPNGDLLAGGDFTAAGGVAANHIARWDGTQWRPIGGGIDGTVAALAVMPNGDLIAGGGFSTAGGVNALNIARWDGVAWSALGAGLDMGNVTALAVLPSGELVAAGDFFFSGDDLMIGIARWDGASWSTLGAGLEYPAWALCLLPNGDLAVGGMLNDVLRWDGTAWSSMGSPWSYVTSLLVMPDGDLVAGGFMDFSTGRQTGPVARLHNGVWTRLGEVMDRDVYTLAVLPDGGIAAGGAFTLAGDVRADHLAYWNGTAWGPIATNPEINDSVLALAALPDGGVVAGGMFTASGGVETNHIALWNNGSAAALGEGLNDRVNAVAVLPNGDVLAGGAFTAAGGMSTNKLAVWNGTAWSAFGPGDPINGDVNAFAVLPNGDIVVGGDFTAVGRLTVNHIARWDGAAWSSLGEGLNNSVNAIALLPNGEVIAAGTFTASGSINVNRIARWNGTEWFELSTGMESEVSALAALASGDLVAGGSFTTAGGISANHVARWDGSQWHAMGGGVEGSYPHPVSTLAAWPNGDVVAGGWFHTADGRSAQFIARWNGAMWTALGTGMNGPVLALARMPDGDLVAGGAFTAAGGNAAGHIARYTFAAAGIGITQQPNPAAACHAGSATFVVEAGPADQGDLAFRWQVESASAGSGVWTDLTDGPLPGITGSVASALGTDTDTLTIVDADAMAALRYRAVVENACGGSTSSITSDPASLLVCIGDYNCDGGIDGSDVQAFFADWETGSADADLNADGGVDGEDVEFFFLRWENGC